MLSEHEKIFHLKTMKNRKNQNIFISLRQQAWLQKEAATAQMEVSFFSLLRIKFAYFMPWLLWCVFTHWQCEPIINNNNIIIQQQQKAKNEWEEKRNIIILSISFHLKLTPLKCLKDFSLCATHDSPYNFSALLYPISMSLL